jgi:hypothetical protein
MSTTGKPGFTRLIRFEDEDEVVQWGDLGGDLGQGDLTGTKADIFKGSLEGGFTRTDVTKTIAKVGQGCIIR